MVDPTAIWAGDTGGTRERTDQKGTARAIYEVSLRDGGEIVAEPYDADE